MRFGHMIKTAMGLIKERRLVEATAILQAGLNGKEPKASMPVPPIASSSGRKTTPLSEVLIRLKDNRPPFSDDQKIQPSKQDTLLDLPEGASFRLRIYDGEAGRRNFKLYVPESKPSKNPPLLVMLHGCNQNPDDFALGTRMNAMAEACGMIVVYPEQPKKANISGCWNWFNPAHQRRGAGEPAIIAGLTQKIISEFNCNPGRVFVAGLSAGGAMAVIMGECYPDIFSAVGVHSGLAYQSANDIVSAFEAMRGVKYKAKTRSNMRTIVFHGDADTTVHASNGEEVAAMHPSSQTEERFTIPQKKSYTRSLETNSKGRSIKEYWVLHGVGHAWSGGSPAGSYTDPKGPDASQEMLRFFLSENNP